MPQEHTPEEIKAEASSEETNQFVRRVRRVTRRKFTPEEKVRVVLEWFRCEVKVSKLCRREGIRPNVYYAWLKGFMEAGKARLQADTVRGDRTAHSAWRRRTGRISASQHRIAAASRRTQYSVVYIMYTSGRLPEQTGCILSPPGTNVNGSQGNSRACSS